MKALILSLSMLVSFNAFADRMYLVEPMTCVGVLAHRSSGMANGYEKENFTFTSMMSTRRDGSRAMALEIQRDFASNGYMSPLFVSDDGKWIKKVIGAYDETLMLKFAGREIVGGKIVDQWVGTLKATGTVVGNTQYNLTCRAVVVNRVSRIDDMTARH